MMLIHQDISLMQLLQKMHHEIDTSKNNEISLILTICYNIHYQDNEWQYIGTLLVC